MAEFCIGAGAQVAACSQGFFQGAVDDVSLFASELGASDVADLAAEPASLPSDKCAWQEAATVATEITSTKLVNCSFNRMKAYSVVIYVESDASNGNNDGELQYVQLNSAPIGIHMHTHLTPEVDNVIVFDFFDSDGLTEHASTTITSLPASGQLYNYDALAVANRGSAITSVPAVLTDMTTVILFTGSLNAFEPTQLGFTVTDLWGGISQVDNRFSASKLCFFSSRWAVSRRVMSS